MELPVPGTVQVQHNDTSLPLIIHLSPIRVISMFQGQVQGIIWSHLGSSLRIGHKVPDNEDAADYSINIRQSAQPILCSRGAGGCLPATLYSPNPKLFLIWLYNVQYHQLSDLVDLVQIEQLVLVCPHILQFYKGECTDTVLYNQIVQCIGSLML